MSAPYFVGTKMVAFEGRGGGDYGASHDLDDLIAIIDGREELKGEIESCDVDLIKHIAGTVRKYCDDDDFQDTLAWHLPPDEAGQARLPILRSGLDLIGKLISRPG